MTVTYEYGKSRACLRPAVPDQPAAPVILRRAVPTRPRKRPARRKPPARRWKWPVRWERHPGRRKRLIGPIPETPETVAALAELVRLVAEAVGSEAA